MRKVIFQDELGNVLRHGTAEEAKAAAARGDFYRFSGANAIVQIYRKRSWAEASNAQESPAILTDDDTRALLRMADGRCIDQTRWERLAGYGFDPDPSLMHQA